MSTRWIWGLLFILLSLAPLACEEQGLENQTFNSSHGPGEPSDAIRITETTGTFGDIVISFRLTPRDNEPRTVTLSYTGGCAGAGDHRAATTSPLRRLAPGYHAAVWHSWDQEAGCRGAVKLRLETPQGESAVSDAFTLDNTQEGATGFVEMPLRDQGIQPIEEGVYERAVETLLADSSVDFVAARIGDDYEVRAARGSVVFQRLQTHAGYQYEIVEVQRVNPLRHQDPMWIPTYEDELAAGGNPNNIRLPQAGYPRGDPRLSFIEPKDDSYPFAFERIAAYFDNPNAADLLINWKSYAHGDVDLGEHGSLNIVQSRSPLLMWGQGIRPSLLEDTYKQVDLAPTVAALLGLPKTFGVDHRGVYSHDVYLGWQDGEVIDEALNGRHPKYVFLFTFDGFSHTELYRQIEENRRQLPALKRMMTEGAWAQYGVISNYPSVTMVSHNTIGTGVYGGHHGLVDNFFYVRETDQTHAPVNELFFTEKYVQPIGPAETLHQAVHRQFGAWNPWSGEGAITASLFDPCTLGADKANLEFRDRTHQSRFPPLFLDYYPPEIAYPNPYYGNVDTYGGQFTEWSAMVELYYLLFNGVTPPPRFTIINFTTTDAAGHFQGPHGNVMMNIVPHVDRHLQVLFDWLEELGILRETAIIITSDHGMQLGDPSRSGWPPDALDAAGIKYAPDTWLGVYFKILLAEFSTETVIPGEDQLVTLRVFDEDNHGAVAGAEVTATDGASELLAVTDETGYAEFGITPIGPVTVTVTHESFNRRQYVLEAVEN
jgi:hypothetical protein